MRPYVCVAVWRGVRSIGELPVVDALEKGKRDKGRVADADGDSDSLMG